MPFVRSAWLGFLFFLLVIAALVGNTNSQTIYYTAPDVYNNHANSQLEKENATALFEQAQQTLDKDDLTNTMRHVSQVLHADPNHAGARNVLGYELSAEGHWQTPYEAKQAKRGLQWDSRFGWIRPQDLPRLEAGERKSGRRWISGDDDTKRHEKIENGWQVRTDHFIVTTNHSINAGVAMAAELESLRQVWQQRLAAYDLTTEELIDRFEGKRSAPRSQRPMRVFYHRDKASYVEYLKRRQPRIAQTLGIYFDTIREAHFYHSDDPTEANQLQATLYHEATHQLLQETSPKARSVGTNANYWVVEGIACYFETLIPLTVDGKRIGLYELGDPARGRIVSAVNTTTPPLPLAELVAMGMSDLQERTDLAPIYAQSSALTAMLLDAPDLADQLAFIRYLKEVYEGRPDGGELARELNCSYNALDLQYRAFLEKILSPRTD